MPFLTRTRAPEGSALTPHAGFSVRLDWPHQSHRFTGYGASYWRIEREVISARRYWQRGSVSPAECPIVIISRHKWKLHAKRGLCGAPHCEAGPSIRLVPQR